MRQHRCAMLARFHPDRRWHPIMMDAKTVVRKFLIEILSHAIRKQELCRN